MSKKDVYALDDFYSIKKYDAHVHYYTGNDAFLKLAQKHNFRLISINVDFLEKEWMALADQIRIAHRLQKKHKHYFSFIGAVPMLERLTSATISEACKQLSVNRKNNAIGMKIWKNVGMKITFDNQLVMIDNPIFDPLLCSFEDTNFSLLGHFGEPRNCWLPIDEMTVESDKKYYKAHPEFHMYQQPHMPSYEAQIKACNNMLQQHPKLRFVGAHLGSSEYSISEIAKRLDAYPSMYMDVAERVCHLQHQALNNNKAVYDFFIKYQDRLLYGSDMVFTDNKSENWQKEEVEKRWFSQWRFFTQPDQQTTWEVNGTFNGLGLPKEVVNKLYYKNALKAYPLLSETIK